MSDNNLLNYSTKAKAHDLTLLSLKSKDLSVLSPEELTNKYLDSYNKIYNILETARINKVKVSKK